MVSATEPRLFCVPPPPADDESGPRWNPPDGAPPGPWTVETAYRYCERMATTHYENFPVASRFLPSHLRPNVMAIYAYARTADDFADEPRYENRRVESLDRWEQPSSPRGRSPGATASTSSPTRSCWRWGWPTSVPA